MEAVTQSAKTLTVAVDVVVATKICLMRLATL